MKIHPGEILVKEFMEPKGLADRDLAVATGLPLAHIQELADERVSVTAESAGRLAAFFGTTPQFWLNMQSSYERAVA